MRRTTRHTATRSFRQTRGGWTIDPTGLRYMLNVFYDRYQCPIYITENGVGYFDKLEADGNDPRSIPGRIF